MVTIPPTQHQHSGRIQELFDANNNYLYTKLSPYTSADSSLISFGPKQPYVYKKLTDVNKSKIGNILTKLDNPAFPVKSGTSDVVRISKFLASSHGVFFLGKQFLLQRMQPFNETRIYNPASPLIAAAMGLSMGLLGRPTRHIDTDNLLGSLTGGTFNYSHPDKPKGTADQDGDFNPMDGKGLIRYSTATAALNNLTMKNRPPSGTKSKFGFSPGGLVGLAMATVNNLRPVGSQPNMYRADRFAYNLLYGNTHRKYPVGGNISKNAAEIQFYYKDYKYDDTIDVSGNPIFGLLYSYYDEQIKKLNIISNKQFQTSEKEIGSLQTILNNLYKINGKQYGTSNVDVTYDGTATKTYYNNVGKILIANGNEIENDDKRGMRYINRLEILNGDGHDYIDRIPKEGNHSIPFFFHDMVNNKYIPFQATIKGIGETSQAEWSEVKYIGRADKLYNYNGYARSMNFGFVVVADSIRDLLPMWKRINYLYGLTKPSNYVSANSSNTTGGNIQYISHFVVPPIVKMTIGDFYKNQPIVIDSIQITIPDDAQWETVSEFSFSGMPDWTHTLGRISTSGDGLEVAQFPRVCELQVQCKLLEKERPQSGHNNWGDSLLSKNDIFTKPFSNKMKYKNKWSNVLR
jgi:hypothetical protein